MELLLSHEASTNIVDLQGSSGKAITDKFSDIDLCF